MQRCEVFEVGVVSVASVASVDSVVDDGVGVGDGAGDGVDGSVVVETRKRRRSRIIISERQDRW